MYKLLLAIAALGLVVSGYLLVKYVTPEPIVCLTDWGCDEVRDSRYAAVLGWPTPLYGVVYYLGLGGVAVWWKPGSRWWLRWLLVVMTGAGFAVSLLLTYLEAFVIEAWCSWCIMSAVLATAAFLLVWFSPGVFATRRSSRRRQQD